MYVSRGETTSDGEVQNYLLIMLFIIILMAILIFLAGVMIGRKLPAKESGTDRDLSDEENEDPKHTEG